MKLGTMLSEKGKDYFYIMHLSYNGSQREELWNYAKEEDLIGLDAPRIVRDNWSRVRESVKGKLSKTWVRQFDILCSEMVVGDIVLVLNGWNSLLGIAEILGRRHGYDKDLSKNKTFFDHVRQVRWIRKYEYANRKALPEPLKGFNNTLSRVTPSSPRWSILKDLAI